MGENTQVTAGQQNPKDRMQQEIRHTEAHISTTVHEIEDRLSPSNIKRRAVQQVKQSVLKAVVQVLDVVQKRPGQTAMVGAGVLWMMLRKKSRSRKKTATAMELAGTAAKAFVSGAAGRQHKESSSSARSIIWRGLATAIGAALGSSWYRRKPEHVTVTGSGRVAEQPRAGAYPGMAPRMTVTTHAPR